MLSHGAGIVSCALVSRGMQQAGPTRPVWTCVQLPVVFALMHSLRFRVEVPVLTDLRPCCHVHQFARMSGRDSGRCWQPGRDLVMPVMCSGTLGPDVQKVLSGVGGLSDRNKLILEV